VQTTGAEAMATTISNAYLGGGTAFASASSYFPVVRSCLLTTSTSVSSAASSSVTSARTSVSSGDASGAAQAITTSLCDPVSASAVAEAFAAIIVAGIGCNGVVYEAITSKSRAMM